jgi:quinol monooxygenase YgiN
MSDEANAAAERLILVVSFRARAGGAAALERRLRQMATLSLAEPGCLEYTLHADADDPDRYLLYEQWADQAALDLHDATTYVHEFIAAFPDLLAEPIGKRRLRRLP